MCIYIYINISWEYIWGFPEMVVPQNGWLILENPIKMDDLGVPLFQETSNDRNSLVLLSPTECDSLNIIHCKIGLLDGTSQIVSNISALDGLTFSFRPWMATTCNSIHLHLTMIAYGCLGFLLLPKQLSRVNINRVKPEQIILQTFLLRSQRWVVGLPQNAAHPKRYQTISSKRKQWW